MSPETKKKTDDEDVKELEELADPSTRARTAVRGEKVKVVLPPVTVPEPERLSDIQVAGLDALKVGEEYDLSGSRALPKANGAYVIARKVKLTARTKAGELTFEVLD